MATFCFGVVELVPTWDSSLEVDCWNPRAEVAVMEQRALKKLVESFRKTVKCFKKFEVECLIRLFYSLAGCPIGKVDNIKLDCNAFRGVLQNFFGMTNDVLMNRVFFVFDKDGDSHVNLQEWIKGLAVFLRGTFEEKMRFCFEVYYLSGDAYISREKIFDMLKSSLFHNSPEEENEEGIKDLVEISLKKMDYDNDGKISFADFEKAVRKDGLLLEAFGPCLPDAKTCFHFEALVFKNNSPASFEHNPLNP